MALTSLNQLRRFRNALLAVRTWWLRTRHGLVLGQGVSISLSARFRGSGPGSIHVGERTLIAFKTLFLTRDEVTGEVRPIRIGKHCFIGGGSIITPGVTIGDASIVGGGSVVFDDVPGNCIVVGNPARILRRDVEIGPLGRLPGSDENTDRMYYDVTGLARPRK
jgi:acetyltransferase-like isoleucine patch superfamily enzyme